MSAKERLCRRNIDETLEQWSYRFLKYVYSRSGCGLRRCCVVSFSPIIGIAFVIFSILAFVFGLTGVLLSLILPIALVCIAVVLIVLFVLAIFAGGDDDDDGLCGSDDDCCGSDVECFGDDDCFVDCRESDDDEGAEFCCCTVDTDDESDEDEDEDDDEEEDGDGEGNGEDGKKRKRRKRRKQKRRELRKRYVEECCDEFQDSCECNYVPKKSRSCLGDCCIIDPAWRCGCRLLRNVFYPFCVVGCAITFAYMLCIAPVMKCVSFCAVRRHQKDREDKDKVPSIFIQDAILVPPECSNPPV